MTVVSGNGDGTFTPNLTIPTGIQPSGIVAADFDQNGTVDLAVTAEGDAVDVLINTCLVGGD
jgi:hypothetical protein